MTLQLTRAKYRRPFRPREAIAIFILLAVSVVWVYPFLWMVSTGFKSNSEVFAGTGLWPANPTIESFRRAWWTGHIGQNFLNTVILSLGAVAIVTVTTAMIGYVLGRFSFPGRKVLFVLFVGSVFVPEGYTIIPVFELLRHLGLSNSLLGMILAEAGTSHVLFILLFAGFFSQLPRELDEAAAIDGAGFLRTFLVVMLPMSRPVIATAVVLQFMASWNSYFLPLVLSLANPSIRTLGVGMVAFRGEYFTDWSGLAAAATISQIPVILVFLLLQRYFVEGIAGAIKS